MVDMQPTGAAPASGTASPVPGPAARGAVPLVAPAAGLAAPLDGARQDPVTARDRAAAGRAWPSEGALKAAVDDANQALAAIGTQLVFVFDDQSHHLSVKLFDVQTQKVVQQIPPAAMPATASALSASSASGALVDTKA